jgi:hypothetical protein
MKKNQGLMSSSSWCCRHEPTAAAAAAHEAVVVADEGQIKSSSCCHGQRLELWFRVQGLQLIRAQGYLSTLNSVQLWSAGDDGAETS